MQRLINDAVSALARMEEVYPANSAESLRVQEVYGHAMWNLYQEVFGDEYETSWTDDAEIMILRWIVLNNGGK